MVLIKFRNFLLNYGRKCWLETKVKIFSDEKTLNTNSKDRKFKT